MKYFISFILFIACHFSYAQKDKYVLNNEIGIFIGNTYLQSDFGEANFVTGNVNTGMNFGLAYIADFSKSEFNSKLFKLILTHSKTRIEASYTSISLDFYNYLPNSSEQLNYKAITGTSKQFSIGSFGEFYLFSLKKDNKFQPYFLSGISYSIVNPLISSKISYPNAFLPLKDHITTSKQNALSFTYGLGTRYKLNNIDLLFETRFTPFLSDKIKGLEIDKKQISN